MSKRIYKPWKHGTKPTAASQRHVDIGTRLFLDGEQFFHFWALAPTQPGIRWGNEVGTTEFVWLIEDESREIVHALVSKTDDAVYWINGKGYTDARSQARRHGFAVAA